MKSWCRWVCFIVMSSVCLGATAANDNRNCQRLITFNYHYSPTYSLVKLDSDRSKPGFTFNFSVRALSDGHLRLSSTDDVKYSPVTFEVVLGAGANTFSSVRRKPKRSSLPDLSVNTDHILNASEMRSFSLVLQGGTLEVYSNKSNIPLLHFEDASVVDMEYIAFGAWNNVAVEWSFDCRDAEPYEPPETDPLLRLKKTYWSRYDPFSPPVLDNHTLVVDVSMSIINLDLRAKEAKFILRGLFEIEWIDQKLRWNPEDYGNITHLNFKHRVVWMPEFTLLDVPKVDSSILEERTVRLYNNGKAVWKSLGETETWCDVDVTDWPNDEHVCEVHIGLRSNPDTVQVQLTGTPIYTGTSALDWEVLSVISEVTTIIEEDVASSQAFKLFIKFKRIKSPFIMLFLLPLIVSFLVLISTFLIAPHFKIRLALVSACVLMLYLILFMEDALLPAQPQGTPRIMKITTCLMLMAALQLIFHSFNIHIARIDIPAPRIVKIAAKKSWMKHLHKATYESFSPDDQKESDLEKTDHEDVDQDETSSEAANLNKYHWALVSRGLDVLLFTLSFIILPFLVAPL